MNSVCAIYEKLDNRFNHLEAGKLVLVSGTCSSAIRRFTQNVAINAALAGSAVVLFTGGHPESASITRADEIVDNPPTLTVDHERRRSTEELFEVAKHAFDGTDRMKLIVIDYDYMLQFDSSYRERLDEWGSIKDPKEKFERTPDLKKDAMARVAKDLRRMAQSLNACVLATNRYPRLYFIQLDEDSYAEHLERDAQVVDEADAVIRLECHLCHEQHDEESKPNDAIPENDDNLEDDGDAENTASVSIEISIDLFTEDDDVWFPHCEGTQKGLVKAHVMKSTCGDTGEIDLMYDPDSGRFQ